jgi:PAP2 superfamily
MSSAAVAARAPQRPSTPPARRPKLLSWRVAVQVALIAAFLMLYKAVIVVAGQDVGVEARRNGRAIIRAERILGIYNEQAVQAVFTPDFAVLVRFFNFYYGSVHFAATLCVLAWLYFRRPDAYRPWRNLLGAVSVISIFGYWLYPVAPPRMFPGFVDTLDFYGGIWSYKAGVAETLANQYAAMPSLHTGWSMWCGLALFCLATRRTHRALAVFHPTITVLGIVITGNHFWLDAVGAFAVVAVAVALCRGPLRRAILTPTS